MLAGLAQQLPYARGNTIEDTVTGQRPEKGEWTMERKYLHRVILASVIVFGLASRTWGEQHALATKPGPDSSPLMARFYTGSVVSIGEFPGTLVRLSCDSNGSANTPAQGHQRGRDYALVVRDDDTIHPLFPGTDEVRRELNSVDLQGTVVAVLGKYYPSTGAILVSRIVVAKSAPQDQTGGSTVGLITGHDGLRLTRCASD